MLQIQILSTFKLGFLDIPLIAIVRTCVPDGIQPVHQTAITTSRKSKGQGFSDQ